MTDITNKLTTEEKEAYIKSVEKELKQKDHSNKYFTGGIITASSSLPITILGGPGTLVLGMILMGGTMIIKSIYMDSKIYTKITEKKQEIEQTYKQYK
ncbi:MAG: hypothetical protein ABIC91_05815 [Nanoarchaeota archaeon]|nr:hypothetical protein [Nanoarchaeota archaeon]MBU1030818.1 hypothetical protein [Nanoarchaeota archaeon]MBU1850170.1 hypothetical protein [Nanoarchaeota archaeon]